MVGISNGPRKFVMQKGLFNWSGKVADGGAPVDSFNDGANPADWNLLPLNHIVTEPIPALAWNTTKMDCRAFNQGGKGLQLYNATIQENGPVFQKTDAPVELDGGVVQIEPSTPLLVMDILTTEEMNINAIWSAANLVATPSFISWKEINSGGTGPLPTEDSTNFNPSMVIYGAWRYYQNSTDRQEGLTPLQAGQFGLGEVIVAPHVYWTRLVKIPDIRSNQQEQNPPVSGIPDVKNYLTIPASNLLMVGDIVDLSNGEELAQMARATMR